MHALISYPAGIVIEGVIVSRSRNQMRVVAAGFSDALELRRKGTNWFTERGEEVQFEFLATDSPAAGVVSPAAVARAQSAVI